VKARGFKGGVAGRGQRVTTPAGPGELITAWRPQRGYLLAHKGPAPLFFVVELDDGTRCLVSAELVQSEPEGDDAA
jgi:hypothetical protein